MDSKNMNCDWDAVNPGIARVNPGIARVNPGIARVSESVHRGLSFLDFIPERTEAGGFSSEPKYEPFTALMRRGNEWLARNPDWEAATCESGDFRASRRVPAKEITCRRSGEGSTAHVRCLRLWVRQRTRPDRVPQQLSHLNFVPDVVDRKKFGTPKFLPLGDMVQKMNEMLRTNPLPGRIITIETQETMAGVDPDRTYWTESAEATKLFVFVIRIFFQTGFSGRGTWEPQEIGLADFRPVCERPGGAFSHPRYESFSSLAGRMSAWCLGQSDIRIANVQSIKYKLKHGETDTRRTWYTEHGYAATFYVRILRVAHVRAWEVHLPPVAVTCRTFSPVQLERGGLGRGSVDEDEDEDVSRTRDRVAVWMWMTGANFISAQTSAVRLDDGGEKNQGPEATYTFNDPGYVLHHPHDRQHLALNGRNDFERDRKSDEHWINIIRLYLDGEYKEPPMELMPSAPQVQQPSCCNIV